MKSSRLISVLLLLQTRGRMTAAQLAAELEVSVRTIYRDVESLHAAGVPLYGDAGHSGGYQLLTGHRSRLTDLYTGEAEALFLAGIPGAAAELGLGGHFVDAQLKLRASLPTPLRDHVDRLRARFHIDAPGWYAEDTDAPFLPQVAEAVRAGRVLAVRYRRWKEPTDVDRRLEPYGLVLKAGRWYLVAGPGPRTYRVDQILELDVTEEECEIPDGFDLVAHWRDSQAGFHARLHQGEAVVRLPPDGARRLTGEAARACAVNGSPEPDGWTLATLPIESLAHAHDTFLALGADVEVLQPAELRARITETVTRLAARYGATPPSSATPPPRRP
ncbi:YafY family transcriptional regulator [Streptomyces sp. Je 1-79]|uniref:helix-turn-helix transcriptional regulator n=1 Tax=Streptomyces sp. Je 1-79 TaxID=2943847 RepID=UPI0021A6E204|nr:YafY family protein [Streptomyces sp. Je 1-79]MCT4353174.1 YafY family transcriptional regulator [Streptomyces sp. Je 1-79]